MCVWRGKWCILRIRWNQIEIQETWKADLQKGLNKGGLAFLLMATQLLLTHQCCSPYQLLLILSLLYNFDILITPWSHGGPSVPRTPTLLDFAVQASTKSSSLCIYLFKVLRERSEWTDSHFQESPLRSEAFANIGVSSTLIKGLLLTGPIHCDYGLGTCGLLLI